MTHSSDFAATVRAGRRIRRGAVVVHQLDPETTAPHDAMVGFVVSRAVGGSVVRHRVARQLRAVLGARLSRLPNGSRTIVRALPPAAGASTSALALDVDAALGVLAAPRRAPGASR